MGPDKNNDGKDWKLFEQAVDIALKTPAKHKTAIRKKPNKSAQKKPR